MAKHMRGAGRTPAGNGAGNSSDPFSANYVDPALSDRQRRKLQARQEPGGGKGWALLYLLLAVALAAALWFLMGGAGA